jgi:tRNA pseudouridine13 synthase
MPGGPYNTHLIGKAIIENDWRKAYEYMKSSNNITPEIIVKNKDAADFSGVFKLMNPKKLSFFVSAYNSFLWNKHASLVIDKNTKSKEYLFENVGMLNLPLASSFQCPHICAAEGYEFLTEKFIARSKEYKRNLIIGTTVYGNNLEIDELHKGKKKIIVSFFLPTGCYATMIIKQLFLSVENK